MVPGLRCAASQSGRPNRCYEQDVAGGPPRAITPEQTDQAWPSPDGASLLVHHSAAANVKNEPIYALYPSGGGAPRPVPWLRNGIDTVV
jgi:hypothetical protein